MKCFFAGCAKNCAPYLEAVFRNIEIMSRFFDESELVVIIGDSQDDTVPIIQSMRSKYPYLPMQILYNKEAEQGLYRTQRISAARNLLFENIMSRYTPGDFMIMLDFDDVCSGSINSEVFRETVRRNDWDSVSFWSRTPYGERLRYYDIWALSYKPMSVSCWNWGKYSQYVVNFMSADIENRLQPLLSNAGDGPPELLPVYSAFGGLAIYRLDKFVGCKYYWQTPPFHNIDQDDYTEMKQIITYIVHTPDVEYIHYQGSQDCEHRAFHAEAREKNGARIRICPLTLFAGEPTV